jgi:hypothetical protein
VNKSRLAILAALIALLATSSRAESEGPEQVRPSTGPVEMLRKASTEVVDTLDKRLDAGHDWLYRRLQHLFEKIDLQFGPEQAPIVVPLHLPPLLSRSRSAPLTNPSRVLMRTVNKSQLRLAQTHSILIQPFNFHPHKPLSVRYRTHCARQATSRCGRRTCRRDVRRGNCRWACRAPAFGADTSRS